MQFTTCETERLRTPAKLDQKIVHKKRPQGMMSVLVRRIERSRDANPWQIHHRAEWMPKASARGVQVERHPPGTCHSPLATMRKIPGVWRQSHQGGQSLSVRSITKLNQTNLYCFCARSKHDETSDLSCAP